jgi:hypothetical protein
MASKLKKALKKIGKAAAVAGAGYLAMKGLGKRKQNKAFLATEGGDKSDMRDYGPFSKGANQGGDSQDTTNRKTAGRFIDRINNKNDRASGMQLAYKSGGRAGKKSKPKSIGKALRGGGKVMR